MAAHNYIISKESLVSIPKVNAELEMLEVSIAHLAANMTTEVVNNFKLNLKGKILKQEGTIQPDFGFLFVKGAAIDPVAAIAKATALSANKNVRDFNKNAGGDIIYVASQPGPGYTGEQVFNDVEDNIPKRFELGQEYTVYCWLKDGGDVFVSGKSVELKIPKVVGSIPNDGVKDSVNDFEMEKALVIGIQSQVNSQKYFNENSQAVWGFFFVKDGFAVDIPGDFESILTDAQQLEQKQKRVREINAKGGKETVPGDNLDGRTELSGTNKVFLRISIGMHQQNYALGCKGNSPMTESSKYQVYFWVRDGNTIFYSDAANKLLETLKDFKKGDQPDILEAVDMNTNYQEYSYIKQKQQVYGIKAGGEPVLLNKKADEALLREVFSNTIKKKEPAKKQEIDAIITSLNLKP
jgi:hypothetical protein